MVPHTFTGDNASLRLILGQAPSSDVVCRFLADLAGAAHLDRPVEPEVKCYPDGLYMNYHPLGLSLLFIPNDGSKSTSKDDIQGDKLKLESICIYNVIDARTETRSKSYSNYPLPHIVLPLVDKPQDCSVTQLTLTPSLTGADIVSCLGEPSRKGGGSGPLSGSINIWCEWSKEGVMVEFGGDQARGPQAWERGKDAIWKTLTIFEPS